MSITESETSSRIWNSWRFWRALFWTCVLARFLSLIPFIIDDDEAFRVVSARNLSSIFKYYFQSVDNKPPGMVWFYSWVAKFLGGTVDPRFTRLVFTLILIGLAFLVSRLAKMFQPEGRRASGWMAAALFWTSVALASPKLLTVTDEGALSIFIIAAYSLALLCSFPGAAFWVGSLLGAAMLVKQTALFFFLPILFARFPKRWSLSQILLLALGAVVIYIPVVFACDWKEFLYWNETYPRQVLSQARHSLFDSGMDLVTNTLHVIIVLLPVCIAAGCTLFGKSRNAFKDFRLWWLLSALMAAYLGKGIFLHYFILAVPPLVLIAIESFNFEKFSNRLGLVWLLLGYGFACAVIAVPFSGLFWGNDLGYYQSVGERIKKLTPAGGAVLIWGGSSLPLAYADVPYGGRFVLPRFAEVPYGTDKTLAIFHQEFLEHPPALIVDLHERGDNRFDNLLTTDPVVFREIQNHFQVVVAPSLPWVKFYVRFLSPSPDLLKSAGVEWVSTHEGLERVYRKFPSESAEWDLLGRDLKNAAALDPVIRAKDSLELAELQSQDPQVRDRARILRASFDLPSAEQFLASRGEDIFLPMRSALWWPEVAIVELQPRGRASSGMK